MSESEPDLSICSTCNNTFAWHRLNNPRHRFTTVNTSDALDIRDDHPDAPTDKPGGKVVPMTMPFDPVLRVALIDAGVITVEQLDAADAKIRHLTRGVEATNG